MNPPHRILLVTPCSPFSPQSGTEQRTALLYEALRQIGRTDVLLVATTDAPSHAKRPEDSRLLSELLWQQSALGFSKYRPEHFACEDGSTAEPDYGQYDLIVGRYLNPICKLRIPNGITTVVDLDDWGKTYGTSEGLSPAALARRLKHHYAYWLARRQLKRFDGFFFVSGRDSGREPRLASEVLPNIPFSAPAQPLPDTASTNLLFVGALWYGPNAHGINHFLRHCWPRIRSAVPAATLTLVGAAPPEVRRNWEALPGVKAPGFVDDLADAYGSAAFTIAPIYFGGGTNIKVVESLAFGRACVTTPHCAAAFRDDLVAGGGISVADGDASFSDLCVRLLTDPALRMSQAVQGYKLVSASYNRMEFTRAVLRLTERLLDAKRQPAARRFA